MFYKKLLCLCKKIEFSVMDQFATFSFISYNTFNRCFIGPFGPISPVFHSIWYFNGEHRWDQVCIFYINGFQKRKIKVSCTLNPITKIVGMVIHVKFEVIVSDENSRNNFRQSSYFPNIISINVSKWYYFTDLSIRYSGRIGL